MVMVIWSWVTSNAPGYRLSRQCRFLSEQTTGTSNPDISEIYFLFFFNYDYNYGSWFGRPGYSNSTTKLLRARGKIGGRRQIGIPAILPMTTFSMKSSDRLD
jgi:hypothetical protein